METASLALSKCLYTLCSLHIESHCGLVKEYYQIRCVFHHRMSDIKAEKYNRKERWFLCRIDLIFGDMNIVIFTELQLA